ncbi:SLC13 family permease [Yunchengibacter salinarum]|uniref:SLC13 family permease n=1 Tax=Yunchengibacter salinarum TaxID=3133399 RepID=UPI0035B5B364
MNELEPGILRTRRIGMVLGPLAFLGIYALPAPAGVTADGWMVVAVAALMAVWWVTEAIPVAATALLPLVLLPLLGATDTSGAALPYARPVIFLLLGGFIAATAMQKWSLHRRIALAILARTGDDPKALIGGFMGVAAVLSMWISNTATTLMIIPIAITVVDTVLGEKGRTHPFCIALLIGSAWAASIGGLGTYIGTPPNAFVKGFIEDQTGITLTFIHWMAFAVPVVVVMVPLAWLLLTRLIFPFRADLVTGGHAVVRAELEALGTMTRPERRVAVVMGSMAFLWVARPFLQQSETLTALIPPLARLGDMHIAIGGALAMFLVPSAAGPGQSRRLLDWENAESLPWGVLVLFGGGLSLASAIQSTGLAIWLGEALSPLAAAPLYVLILAIVALVIFLTELTSNTATTAALVPVLGALAAHADFNPILLAAPAAMAASCAFMLPVATGPNAVIFSTGRVRIPTMARAGFWMNVIGTFVVSAITYALVPLVFDL